MKNIACSFLLILACLAPKLQADETDQKTPAPGYRPDSEYAEAFVNSAKTAQLVVYPTVVRIKTPDSVVTSHSSSSQKAIRNHLIKSQLIDPNGLDLTQIEGRSQFDFFQSSMKMMADQTRRAYHLAAEVIVIQQPNNHLGVWGIHMYILDQAGNNAFSFLLNSHHQLLVDAKLFSEDHSEAAVDRLVARSTQVILKALDQQIEQAR